MKLGEKFLKERYEKDERYFKVYENYTPNYRHVSITSKFYSKYDAIDFSQVDSAIVEAIKVALDKGPREKYKLPVTENQCYGWYTTLLLDLDRSDKRLYFPNISSPITKHQMLLKSDKAMNMKIKPRS